MKIKTILVSSLILLTGCFSVGRMPFTTANGPDYQNAENAIIIPRGSQTQILMVNNEPVRADFLDKLANLSLKLFLMYLEPQVNVRPGNNVITVRAIRQDSNNYGTVTVTTTTWKDYRINANLEPGVRYTVIADLYSGAKIIKDIEIASSK